MKRNALLIVLTILAVITVIRVVSPKPGTRYEITEVHAQTVPTPTPTPYIKVLQEASDGFTLYQFKDSNIFIFCGRAGAVDGGVSCVEFTGVLR